MVAITQFLYNMESGFNYLHIAKCSGDICNKLGENSPFTVTAEGFCDPVGIQGVTGRMSSSQHSGSDGAGLVFTSPCS